MLGGRSVVYCVNGAVMQTSQAERTFFVDPDGLAVIQGYGAGGALFGAEPAAYAVFGYLKR